MVMNDATRLLIVFCYLSKMGMLDYFLDGKMVYSKPMGYHYRVGPHEYINELIDQVKMDPNGMLDFYEVPRLD